MAVEEVKVAPVVAAVKATALPAVGRAQPAIPPEAGVVTPPQKADNQLYY